MNLYTPERKNIVNVWAARAKTNPALVGALVVAVVAAFVGPEIGAMSYYRSLSEKLAGQVKKARADLTNLQSSQVNLAQEFT